MLLRTGACSLLVFASLVMTGCAAPPDKEMQQAQGAIDAAKAAGADQYAREELAGAEAALQRATDAVAVGDYRLALSHALDSRERAQESAKVAADGQAAARVEADRALTALTEAVAETKAALGAAKANHAAAQQLRGAQRAIEDAERRVQEARAAVDKGEYARASTLAASATADLKAAAGDLKAATPQPRRRR